jgi:pyrroloquinoline quinone biosynthesis protein B
VLAFTVAGDAPRFARQEAPGHTVGLLIRDARTGGACAFVPGCGGIDSALLSRLGQVGLLLFDGTFWEEDELVKLGISDRPASALGHVPIGGPAGSLERFSTLPLPQRVYTHINNSNPVLVEDSAERKAVLRAGWVVGDDGMRFSL